MEDYHGKTMVKIDCETLLIFETLIGQQIPDVSHSEKNSFGYVIINGQITELNLQNIALSSLPEEIGNFSSLLSLDLSKNELLYLPETFGNLRSLQKP